MTLEEFYLKLSKPNYDDLVVERCGNDVFVGHYFNQNGDRVPDPVLVMDYNGGYWYPVRIEQTLGETPVSYMQDGKRMIYSATGGKAVRLEYYEGHNALQLVFDLRSKELQGKKLPNFMAEDERAYDPAKVHKGASQ